MKKILLTIALVFTSLFMFSGEVHAEEIEICRYLKMDAGINIAINFNTENNEYTIYTYEYDEDGDYDTNLFTNIGMNFKGLAAAFGADVDLGFIKERNFNLYDADSIYKNMEAEKLIKKGECPNVYYRQKNNDVDVCLDEGAGHCNKINFNGIWMGTSEVLQNFNAKVATDIRGNINFNDVSCSEIKNSEDALMVVQAKISSILPSLADKLPVSYVDHFYQVTKEKYVPALYNAGYTDFKNRCQTEIENNKAAGKITEEEANKQLAAFNISTDYINAQLDYNLFVDLFKRGYVGKLYCGFIGERTFEYVQMIYSLIKFLIPAIIILFGMIDFLKVLLSGEDKDMKLAWTSFVKRIIAGIIFILLPVLIEFIFKLVGFSENCIQQLIS